jgi:integrase
MYRFRHLNAAAMPRTNRPPSYRHHKARECAVVTIDGRNHYLGQYGSQESYEKYARLIAGWGKNDSAAVSNQTNGALSIDELFVAYWRHVETYYVKDGRPTSEQDNISQALRFLRRLYGCSSALEFGPLALKKVRQSMIDAGRCRKLINKDVNRIRGMFSWAVENELLPVHIHQALLRVKGLRKGRSAAKETAPVPAVLEESITAIVPHLSPQVAAMIQLQHLCGARPQEVISIRPCEVLKENGVWFYIPRSHKTQHFDRRKVIVIGPKAQAVLGPWLERDPETYCFVPAEVAAWQNQRSRKKGATKPKSKASNESVDVRPGPGQCYTRHSYRVAVQRACRRAGVPVWSPRQLRHTRATHIRARYGLEAAKAVLGHSDTKVTEIYAERDLALAVKIMGEIG